MGAVMVVSLHSPGESGSQLARTHLVQRCHSILLQAPRAFRLAESQFVL